MSTALSGNQECSSLAIYVYLLPILMESKIIDKGDKRTKGLGSKL